MVALQAASNPASQAVERGEGGGKVPWFVLRAFSVAAFLAVGGVGVIAAGAFASTDST